MKQDNKLQIFFLVEAGRKKPELKAIGAKIGVSIKEATWKVDVIEVIKTKYTISKGCYPELLFVPFAMCKLSRDKDGYFELKKSKHARVFFALKNARRREKAESPKSFYKAMESFAVKKDFLKNCFRLGRERIYLNPKSGFLEKDNILICDYEKIKGYIGKGDSEAFLAKVDVTTLKKISLPDETIKECVRYFAKQKQPYFEYRYKRKRLREIESILAKPERYGLISKMAALLELSLYIEVYPQKVLEFVKKYKVSTEEKDRENYVLVLGNMADFKPDETIQLCKKFLADRCWEVRVNASSALAFAGSHKPFEALETLKPFINEYWDDTCLPKRGILGPTYKDFGLHYDLAIERMAEKNPEQTIPVLKKWAVGEDTKLKRFLCVFVRHKKYKKEIAELAELLLKNLDPEKDSAYIEWIGEKLHHSQRR